MSAQAFLSSQKKGDLRREFVTQPPCFSTFSLLFPWILSIFFSSPHLLLLLFHAQCSATKISCFSFIFSTSSSPPQLPLSQPSSSSLYISFSEPSKGIISNNHLLYIIPPSAFHQFITFITIIDPSKTIIISASITIEKKNPPQPYSSSRIITIWLIIETHHQTIISRHNHHHNHIHHHHIYHLNPLKPSAASPHIQFHHFTAKPLSLDITIFINFFILVLVCFINFTLWFFFSFWCYLLKTFILELLCSDSLTFLLDLIL